MKRRTIIAWLGFLVILTTFLGVPIQWKEYALIILGVLIMIVALSGGRRKSENRSNASYVENKLPSAVGEKRV